MALPFTIDPQTGQIRIGDAAALRAGEHRTSVEPRISPWLEGTRDLGNGHAWLDLRGLTFGGEPAALALCFHEDRLEQAAWSVRLRDAGMQSGWPAREAIEAELAFVQRTLAEEMGMQAGLFAWGELWSHFDSKGFLASNGLRYRRP